MTYGAALMFKFIKRYWLIFVLLAIPILGWALLNTYQSSSSVCRLCGQFRSERGFLGIPYSTKIGYEPEQECLERLQTDPCQHQWVFRHHSESSITGSLTLCAVGHGGGICRVFNRLAMCMNMKSIDDANARAFLKQIQHADIDHLEPIGRELEQAFLKLK